jgi:hypothetical protein
VLGRAQKLGHLAQTDDGKQAILRGSMFTPIKIRQAVLENLSPLMSKLMGGGKMKKALV